MIWIFDASGKVKNAYDTTGSIDPCKVHEYELEWKRAKNEFKHPMPQGVTVFIEYDTPLSTSPPHTDKTMLLLKKIDPKTIHFVETKIRLEGEERYIYLKRKNFLKDFGLHHFTEVWSAKKIIEAASKKRGSNLSKIQLI